jgi:hypothetical protein
MKYIDSEQFINKYRLNLFKNLGLRLSKKTYKRLIEKLDKVELLNIELELEWKVNSECTTKT